MSNHSRGGCWEFLLAGGDTPVRVKFSRSDVIRNLLRKINSWADFWEFLLAWTTRLWETSKNSQKLLYYWICLVISLQSWLLRISTRTWQHESGRLAKILKIHSTTTSALCEITLESWILRISACRWRNASLRLAKIFKSTTSTASNNSNMKSPVERWGAGVETQKNVRWEVGGWSRVPFNEPYAPSLSTIYDGAWGSSNSWKWYSTPAPHLSSCAKSQERWRVRISICRWRHALGRRRLWLVGAGLGHFRI